MSGRLDKKNRKTKLNLKSHDKGLYFLKAFELLGLHNKFTGNKEDMPLSLFSILCSCTYFGCIKMLRYGHYI